jgi:hypothetical protein
MFEHECVPYDCRDECVGGRVDEAKAVCFACPVRGPCTEWMMTNKQDDGVIAGTTKQERIKMRKAAKNQ